MEDQMTRQNISNAWRLHREGNSDAAIDGFKSILAGDSANIDALYGIGLAYRAMGQNERAVESLTAAQNALAVAEEMRLAEGEKTVAVARLAFSDPIAGEGDRFFILSRMVSQRLEELGVAPA